ncbi:hypothetical protein GL263_23510 [Streptomyces durbertensis]|uniref:Secreted protein n=1 Tax=Streptomyces durbertensis TaxID=2448886 RepID=A0ABR6ENL5_9ACTN|nr:hypothetical protein [Streptomyces durbertensis]MBB1246495.1 hypothetical protein [Streptomyces durbertensis]
MKMITTRRLALGAATAVLGSGLAMAPAASADTLRAPAPTVAPSSVSAQATNFSCTLPKGTKWKTCRQDITVTRGKTLSVELVSSGGKTLNVSLGSSGNDRNQKAIKPGEGYAVHWTNNSNSTKKASILVKRKATVKVQANLRYKVG